MKASLRSARIAPKKLNVIAKMVRGMPTSEALKALQLTHKKAARLIEALLASAVANATFNDKQKEEDLVVKSIVVNQAQGYRRGVPMARGRVRPMRKFLSHIEIILGIREEEQEGAAAGKKTTRRKSGDPASQEAKKTVKRRRGSQDQEPTSTTSRTSVTSPTS